MKRVSGGGQTRMPSYSAYFLVGPTCVGKSAVAQAIAERRGFALLAADSMSVYRGMDIGTGKPTVDERRRVPYFGLDLVDPDRTFNAWEFRKAALAGLAECASRGRSVVVVGGSGLYVKSLTHGLQSWSGADRDLRKRWRETVDREGIEPLREAARAADPAAYKALRDRGHVRRLIRLLERAGEPESGRNAGWGERGEAPLAALDRVHVDLKSRIESRVERMYRDGLVEERRVLRTRFGPLSPTAAKAIGYAEAEAVLDGRCSEHEAKARTVTRTVHFARRQRTWFRHQCRVEWLGVTGMDVEEAADRVSAFWDEHGPTAIAGEG